MDNVSIRAHIMKLKCENYIDSKMMLTWTMHKLICIFYVCVF